MISHVFFVSYVVDVALTKMFIINVLNYLNNSVVYTFCVLIGCPKDFRLLPVLIASSLKVNACFIFVFV